MLFFSLVVPASVVSFISFVVFVYKQINNDDDGENALLYTATSSGKNNNNRTVIDQRTD